MEAVIEKNDFNNAVKAFKKLAKSDRVSFVVEEGIFSIISNGLTYFKYNIVANDTVDGYATIPSDVFEKLTSTRSNKIRFSTTGNKLSIESGSKFEIYTLKTEEDDLKLHYKGDKLNINSKEVGKLKNLLNNIKFNTVSVDYKGTPIRIDNNGKIITIRCADFVHLVEIKSNAICKDKFKIDVDLKNLMSIFQFVDDKATIEICKNVIVIKSENIIACSGLLTVGTGSIDDAVKALETESFNNGNFTFNKEEFNNIINSVSIVSDHSDTLKLKFKKDKALLSFNTKLGKSKDNVKIIDSNDIKEIEVSFIIFKELIDTNKEEINVSICDNDKMYKMVSKTKSLQISSLGPLC